jgi:thioredoxin reductase (NADPH)
MSNYDIIIIGGGSGGMGALLWCHSLGLKGVLLEQRGELGGQMLQMFHQVIDYPGLPSANGQALRDHFASHLQQLQLDYRLNCHVEELDLQKLRTKANGEWLQAKAVIIATGVRPRQLGLANEARLARHGDVQDATLYAGQRVCVIGGGDSAVQTSLILARICSAVTLIHHSDDFRARPEWLAEARATANLTIITHARLQALRGDERSKSLLIEDTRSHTTREWPAEAVFIRIGVQPNTEFLQGQVALDEAGYIAVDARQRTSLALIYAVGDVCRPACLSVATAVGHGALAVKDAAVLLATATR